MLPNLTSPETLNLNLSVAWLQLYWSSPQFNGIRFTQLMGVRCKDHTRKQRLQSDDKHGYFLDIADLSSNKKSQSLP